MSNARRPADAYRAEREAQLQSDSPLRRIGARSLHDALILIERTSPDPDVALAARALRDESNGDIDISDGYSEEGMLSFAEDMIERRVIADKR